MQWYYASGGERFGPFDENEVLTLVQNGTIADSTLVWNKTLTDWTKYGDVKKPPPDDISQESQTPDIKKSTCSQCGRLFSQEDMIRYENDWVCAACKPLFFQKLKEGVKVGGQGEYAGFWIRFAAVFLDGLILTFFQMLIIIPAGAFIISRFSQMSSTNSPDFSQMGSIFALQGLLYLVQFSIAVTYETWFIGKYGATPGKMACRIKVITADGGRVSYLRAFGRYFAKLVSWIVLCIGFIMAAFDKEKRALHDHMCETRVVKK